MDSLDLPTHQLLLDGLASNIADSIIAGEKAEEDALSIFASSSARATTSRHSSPNFLSASAAHSQISLARFAASIASASRTDTGPAYAVDDAHLRGVLGDVVQDAAQLTAADVEPTMAWSQWPLPDQLAYEISKSLLTVASTASHHRQTCIDAVIHLAQNLATGLGATSGDAHVVVARLVPMLHGLYRALASTAFAWNMTGLARLVTALTPLTSTGQTVSRLNQVLLVLPEQQTARAQGERATRRKAKAPAVRPLEPGEDDGRSEGSVDTFYSGDEQGAGVPDEVVEGGFTYAQGQDLLSSESYSYRYALLSHYRRLGRPLSGHFVLCSVLEIIGSAMAQALAGHAESGADAALDTDDKDNAGATTRAWDRLFRSPVNLSRESTIDGTAHTNGNNTTTSASGGGLLSAIPILNVTGDNSNSAAFDAPDVPGSATNATIRGLAVALHLASRAYHDVQRFIENEGQKHGQLFSDVYALEILSESLKLGALSSVALSRINNAEPDAHTVVRIRALLSESAPLVDPILQGAALQSANVLVRNCHSLVGSVTTQLRRFVASPQPIFVSDDFSPNPVLNSAAKCLANCVTVAPGDDLAISTMYALLNHLGKDAAPTNGNRATLGPGGAAATAASVRSGLSRAVTGRDFSMGHSHTQALFAQRNEGEKRIIQLSIVTVVSRLALEIDRPELTALTISMLLQRLRVTDGEGEAAILHNLVPLALAGPKASFVDVIRALSLVSRSAISGGANRRTGDGIAAAQLKLAKDLGSLREDDERDAAVADDDNAADSDPFAGSGRKELYLTELLQLFSEKGLALQDTATGGSRSEQSELSADLANLLPSIAAVLSHDDINPQVSPSLEMVSLFRNMWFLSVIFGFTTPSRSRAVANDSASSTTTVEALNVIAVKTPTLVPETSINYLETDLQYNSVLRRDFSATSLETQRKLLEKVIPSHNNEIRSFGFPQVTFLATIYCLECTRSAIGLPSMILTYFVNEGLNTSSLVGSMESIADQVITSFVDDLSSHVSTHSIDPRVSHEVKKLLLGSCHRVDKVRVVSRKFLDRLFGAYPSLICDEDVVFAMLEIATLLRKACEGQYRDEFCPVYHYESSKTDVAFDLSDSYAQREDILTHFLLRVRKYLSITLGRAPVELQSILQRYLASFDDEVLPGVCELGKSIAVDYARSIPSTGVSDVHLPALGGWRADASSSFVGELSAKSTYLGEMTGIHLALTKSLVDLQKDPESNFSRQSVVDCKRQLAAISGDLAAGRHHSFAELRRILYRSAALAVSVPVADYELLHHIVAIPIRAFTPQAIESASHVWTWIIGERPEVETKIMVELSVGWGATAKLRKGIFSDAFTSKSALLNKTEMSAFDRADIVREREKATRLFTPHFTLIRLIASRFQAFRYRDPAMVLALVRMLQRSASAAKHMSTHPLARQARFALVVFGFRLIQSSRLDALVEHQLRQALYGMAFQWFSSAPQFSHGSNRLQTVSEMQILQELLDVLKTDSARTSSIITSFNGTSALATVRLPGYLTLQEASRNAADRRAVLQLLVEDELRRLSVWYNPLSDAARGSDFAGEMARSMTEAKWEQMVSIAWRIDPNVAVQLPYRFKSAALRKDVGRMVRAEPHKIYRNSDALELLTEDHLKLALKEQTDLKWLLYWGPVSPVDAVYLFQPVFNNNPMLLQYAMRALEHHPVELTFFYVPQVVQALRDDQYGYVAQFVFETSKVSQLFCHQILWNMKANSYKDDDAEVPDPMKPTLDRMTSLIVEALSGEAQDFYDREFGFFNEVTSISGKLKPYIKKSKPEKKAKIDEEMAKIRVDPGVYLPSNPDGVVVDLDRKSGRPLQSHAKAPFMATFKVHREIQVDADDVEGDDADDGAGAKKKGIDVWQGAIFKVGDDCRQDVLALQVMAMLKNIYTSVGLDAYLYPYRVTATGPGCGVIDVVANATSRDEMGRSKINSLIDFFKGRFGNVDSVAFQKARMNFIQSMAAYSVACHLLQCRDRHNGNIMIQNDTGHLVHIDFGFLFDIGPGGMHFEPYSFKLTDEFIEVMGGIDSQGFKMFCELTVRAFLAARPYARQIVEVCTLMVKTELPSFKGMPTMERFEGRFMLHLDERQAAQHAVGLIKNAAGNRRSTIYDAIQLAQNGIPYK